MRRNLKLKKIHITKLLIRLISSQDKKGETQSIQNMLQCFEKYKQRKQKIK